MIIRSKNMRSYLKKNEMIKEDVGIFTEELIYSVLGKREIFCRNKSKICVFTCAIFVIISIVSSLHAVSSNQIDNKTITLAGVPIAATSVKKDLISIPAGTVKANPFLPYRDIAGKNVTDVPKYELIEPPEMVNESSDAARVMDTIVSGILYDKFSPSAILNIEGNDYLVKKGDTVNNYKVLNIAQDSVTVKLGNNTYKAGIGEILTEGSINHNEVSNLNNKFGGERQ